jgi:tetratricopeptide (TPR) repeat protein
VTRNSSSAWRGALLVSGLGVLLALPLAEAAVRLLHLAPDIRFIDVTSDDTVYQRSTNPILGFELKKSWRDPDADLVRSYPSTNSYGQRDVERTLAKPPGVKRILMLGASVVEGVGIRDLDDTMSRQYERALGDGTQVLNFGVSAYCTRAKVELLRTKGLAFQPDIVVLVFSRADFDNFNRQAFQLPDLSKPPALASWLFERSQGFRALATRLNLFGFEARVAPARWNAAAIGDDNVVDGLTLFARLAREHHFVPLVAIWPRFTDDGFQDEPPMPGRSGELVEEALCRMLGIPSFRFSSFFARDLATRPSGTSPRKLYTIGDHIHPNPEGCRVAALALKEEVGKLVRAYRSSAAGPRDEAAVAAARSLGVSHEPDTRRLVNVANALLQEGHAKEAVDVYQRVIAEDPKLAEAHHNLGVALRTLGRRPEALLEFAEAARIDPELAEAQLNFGVTLLEMGRPRDAIPALQRAVALRPESEPARQALAAAERAASVSSSKTPEPGGPPPRTTP